MLVDSQVETGDCRCDFRIVRPWADEENEMAYKDAKFPEANYVDVNA